MHERITSKDEIVGDLKIWFCNIILKNSSVALKLQSICKQKLNKYYTFIKYNAQKSKKIFVVKLNN